MSFMKEIKTEDATISAQVQQDKQKIIQKYGLKLENGGWYSEKENTHKQLIFNDAFFQRQDLIGILFRIYKLCFAKVKYFRQHINQFEPYKYHYKDGFVKTELWDFEFLKHRASGYLIDYRYLQSITVYSDFVAFCNELESFSGNESCSQLTNIYDDIPTHLREELTTILAQTASIRIERIVSTGQVSDWYDQEETEFVALLEGNAKIEFENRSVVSLSKGDTLVIAPHEKHRVCFTSVHPPCIWLCVFYTNALSKE